MAWDDIHAPGGPSERPRGSGGGQQGGPPGGGGEGGPQFQMPQIKVPKIKPSTILTAFIVLLLIWIVPSVAYFVEQDEEGVVTRFGKYVRTEQPGLHFKLPSPIEHAYTPKVKKIRRATVGFRDRGQGQEQDVPNESMMLTGDENIVDIDLVVQYHIIDAKNYLFNVKNQAQAVHDVAETAIRGIIGNKKIDEALTTGKAEIQIMLKDQMQAILDKYESGIGVVTTQLKEVNPPSPVAGSFKDVVNAKEDKEKMINDAQGYRNAVIPEARGKSAQIIANAQAYREEVIKRSQGDVSRFMAQYKEYVKAPEVTRKRIYLETMEEVFPNVNKFIMGKKGSGVLPILPLNKNLENALGQSK